MHAPQYRETLFSELYPGKTHSCPTYIPILKSLDHFLQLTPEQKAYTVIRSDAGFGSDYNVDYVLDEGWQILTKGIGGKRSACLMREMKDTTWLEVGLNRWVAEAAHPPTFIKPVQFLLLRWLNPQGETKYANVICSVLDWSMLEVIQHFDDRGGCETQIQADKGGLKLSKRRKIHLEAQEALILLTDLAHNLLSWVTTWMFPTGVLSTFGTTRMIEDVLALPGQLIFSEQGQLQEVQINNLHPYSQHVADGLQRLLDRFENP